MPRYVVTKNTTYAIGRSLTSNFQQWVVRKPCGHAPGSTNRVVAVSTWWCYTLLAIHTPVKPSASTRGPQSTLRQTSLGEEIRITFANIAAVAQLPSIRDMWALYYPVRPQHDRCTTVLTDQKPVACARIGKPEGNQEVHSQSGLYCIKTMAF